MKLIAGILDQLLNSSNGQQFCFLILFFLFLANQQSIKGTKFCRIGLFFSVDKTGLQAWMAGPQAWLAGP